MNIYKQSKQNVFKVPLSPDALRVARALYYSYLSKEKRAHINVKLQNIFKLLKREDDIYAMEYLQELFEELNEPLEILNFRYEGKMYPRRFIFFFKYEIIQDSITIDISPEYIYAHDNYMMDTFLKQ
ncbi:MAG: hypothetical protein PHU40_05540 [Sulfurimonas sp.]|jgi:hypothetical protein|nr:hypothetical protein [Sulfurimonas sp.]